MGTTNNNSGMTLMELIVCTVIIGILTSTALPISKNIIRREKEDALRERLREIREGIDRYRDKMKQKHPDWAEEECYPRTLDDLVEQRILRRIPIDPFTGTRNWRTRSTSDPLDSQYTDGRNVFDVYSTSTETSSLGTPYSSW